jgi:hypothetical protein
VPSLPPNDFVSKFDLLRSTWIWCGFLQVVADLVLKPVDQMLEFSEFSLFSHVGFLVTHIRCLMECA